MNDEIRMVMADNEMPFAIVPHEMLNLDFFNQEAAADPAVIAKVNELNTVLSSDRMVALPSVIKDVVGMFILKLDGPIDETQMEVVRMFCEPLAAHLDAYNATEVTKLLPDLKKV